MNAVQRFVSDLLERAVKSAAQVALVSFGASKLNVLSADWKLVGGLAAGGFVLSVLTSLASLPIGDKTSASLLKPAASPEPASEVATAAVAVPDAVAEAQKIHPLS